jgi:hypothetical protein
MADQDSDWRKLCEAAAREYDPDKFLALIVALNQALEERARKRNEVQRQDKERKSRSCAAAFEVSSFQYEVSSFQYKEHQLDIAEREAEGML